MSDETDINHSEAPTIGKHGDLSGELMPSGDPYRHVQAMAIPESIGEYDILGQIGHGGMGVVLKASHQTDPGRALVAIKLVHSGSGTDAEDILSRFEVECRVLGALGHPNIARYYESGTTKQGQPYVVMEYIEGQTVTAYCDAHNLSIRERLELFRKVCSAVHHAHANLVVHRDIKPENILVTPGGEPKLLDFGIAKLLNPNMAPAVAITGPAVRLMTPEYASPEQVRGEPINTMSDVYSLGVLLYELLTGHRPYHLASRLEHEIIRVICETDPERPSTAISRVAKLEQPDGTVRESDPTRIAEKRAVKPDALRRQLSGDLDDIIMIAMSKVPSQRFPTVQELANEIGRHLRGEPVQARRAKRRVLYVARKFVRRHKTAVSSVGVAFLMTVLLGAVVLDSYLKERAAEEEVAISAKVSDVIWRALDNRLMDVEIKAETRLAVWEQIVVDLQVLAETYGATHPEVLQATARAHAELGEAHGDSSVGAVGNSQRALDYYNQAAEAHEFLLSQKPNDAELLVRSGLLLRLRGNLLRELNRSEEADADFKLAHDRVLAVDPSSPLSDRHRIGMMAILLSLGQTEGRRCNVDRALEHIEQSITVRRQLIDESAGDPELEKRQRWLATGLTNLGQTLLIAGRPGDAEAAFSSALELRESILDRLPPDERRRSEVALSTMYIAQSLAEQGRHDSAIRTLDGSARVLDELIEADPEDTRLQRIGFEIDRIKTDSLIELGENQRATEHAEALVLRADEMERLFPNYGPISVLRADAELTLGNALLAAKRYSDARTLLENARSRSQDLALADPSRIENQRRLAEATELLGDTIGTAPDATETAKTESWALYQRALEIYEQLESEGHLCGVPQDVIDALRAKLNP